jgi:low temperature requirement protein LtrA
MLMTNATELLRKPEQRPRATLLELFFDLIFVFAFTRVTQRLAGDVTVNRWTFVTGIGKTLVLLLALLMVWFVTVWVADLYDLYRPRIQLVIAGTVLGALAMALTLPSAFDKHGLTFAGAYVAIHIGRALVLVPALHGHEAQQRASGVLLWFAVSAVPWIVGAVLPANPTRGLLWTVAVAIDYTGATVLWRPPYGPRPQWPVSAEYLSDRYRQFFIIALGELILIAGITYDDKYLGTYGFHTLALAVSVVTTMLLWWIYTYRSGALLGEAIAKGPDPANLVRRALAAHLLMVVGIMAISAGYKLAIDQPLRHTDLEPAAFILGGPALFIVGRAGLELTVFARISWDRLICLLVLGALTPIMLLVPQLAAAATAMTVLAGLAIADIALNRRPLVLLGQRPD